MSAAAKQSLARRWLRAKKDGRYDEAGRLADRMQPKTRKRLHIAASPLAGTGEGKEGG